MSSFASSLKQHNHFTPGFFELTMRAVARIKNNTTEDLFRKSEKDTQIEIPVFRLVKLSCGRFVNDLLLPQEHNEYQKMDEQKAIEQAELISNIIFNIYSKFYGYFSDVPATMDLQIKKAKDIFIVMCLTFKKKAVKLYKQYMDTIRDLSGFAKNALRRMQREVFGNWRKLKNTSDIVKLIAGDEVSEHISFSKLPVDSQFFYKVGKEDYLVAELDMASCIAGFHNTIGQWEKEMEKKIVVTGTHDGECLVMLPASLMERLKTRENEQEIRLLR